jgi:cell fate regulator YaaT (PSP1 superfamily)
VLEWSEKDFFDEQQQLALQIFPTFKKRFKKYFSTSIPVTARYHLFTDQLYFYFYSEERYVFSEFVKWFRELLNKNIFLFQIWARDMIKMSPWTDCIVGCNGISLCCKSSRALPSVEIENIILQNLEGRDIEKLKGRCWKLKCCLVYELDLYINESEQYPPRWSSVCSSSSPEQCWFVTSFNIINHEVTVRTDDGTIFRLPLSLLKVKKLGTGERNYLHWEKHWEKRWEKTDKLLDK